MNSKGIDSKTLSTMISDNLKNRKIEPIKVYTGEETEVTKSHMN